MSCLLGVDAPSAGAKRRLPTVDDDDVDDEPNILARHGIRKRVKPSPPPPPAPVLAPLPDSPAPPPLAPARTDPLAPAPRREGDGVEAMDFYYV